MVFSLSFQKKYLIFPESKQDSTMNLHLKQFMRISETRANAQKQQKRWNKIQ